MKQEFIVTITPTEGGDTDSKTLTFDPNETCYDPIGKEIRALARGTLTVPEVRFLVEIAVPDYSRFDPRMVLNQWEVAGHTRKYVADKLCIAKDRVTTRVVAVENVDKCAVDRAYEAGIEKGRKLEADKGRTAIRRAVRG